MRAKVPDLENFYSRRTKVKNLQLRSGKAYDGSYLQDQRREVNAMKLPGGMDLGSMMRQAQEMQEQMAREMKETVVDATAGGGAVTVKMRGDFQVVELKISPDIVKDGDID